MTARLEAAPFQTLDAETLQQSVNILRKPS